MSDTSARQFDAHVSLAESGKAAALRGDHANALLRYRDAMRLAAEQHAPEVFRRHYLEISLESLELLEEFDPVIEYCDRAIAHYAAHPPQSDLASLDLASIHQRKGVVLMKMEGTPSRRSGRPEGTAPSRSGRPEGTAPSRSGRPDARDAARQSLAQAIEIGERIGARLELARLLHGWIARGFVIQADRILREQRRLRYFSVRSETMRPSTASGNPARVEAPAASRPGLPDVASRRDATNQRCLVSPLRRADLGGIPPAARSQLI